MRDRLVSLTDRASFHVLSHEFFAMWPPILSDEQFMCLVDSWVCGSG